MKNDAVRARRVSVEHETRGSRKAGPGRGESRKGWPKKIQQTHHGAAVHEQGKVDLLGNVLGLDDLDLQREEKNGVRCVSGGGGGKGWRRGNGLPNRFRLSSSSSSSSPHHVAGAALLARLLGDEALADHVGRSRADLVVAVAARKERRRARRRCEAEQATCAFFLRFLHAFLQSAASASAPHLLTTWTPPWKPLSKWPLPRPPASTCALTTFFAVAGAPRGSGGQGKG